MPCTHVCGICCHTRAATVRRMLQPHVESINVSLGHSVHASLAHEVYSKISYNNGFATIQYITSLLRRRRRYLHLDLHAELVLLAYR